MASPKTKKTIKGEDNGGEENIGQIVKFAKENRFDTIAYILMVVGVLAYIFNPMVGGLMVGGIAGFYFSESIYNWVMQLGKTFDQLGIFRSVVLGGFLLCLVISSTFLLLGVALSAAIMAIVRR